MSYDIYGNPLRRDHCEVHPHVHEEYPCSVCIQENNNLNTTMELEYVLELSQQRIAELERHNDELTATIYRLRDALKHLHHNAKASGAEMGLALDVAEEALESTPQQSLAERDVEVLLKLADYMEEGFGMPMSMGCDDVREYAEKIRNELLRVVSDES